jgi:hypothetical protein
MRTFRDLEAHILKGKPFEPHRSNAFREQLLRTLEAGRRPFSAANLQLLHAEVGRSLLGEVARCIQQISLHRH